MNVEVIHSISMEVAQGATNDKYVLKLIAKNTWNMNELMLLIPGNLTSKNGIGTKYFKKSKRISIYPQEQELNLA